MCLFVRSAMHGDEDIQQGDTKHDDLALSWLNMGSKQQQQQQQYIYIYIYLNTCIYMHIHTYCTLYNFACYCQSIVYKYTWEINTGYSKLFISTGKSPYKHTYIWYVYSESQHHPPYPPPSRVIVHLFFQNSVGIEGVIVCIQLIPYNFVWKLTCPYQTCLAYPALLFLTLFPIHLHDPTSLFTTW